MISDKTIGMDAHLYEELKCQKKEIARLTEERDLLKNAAAYFAKEQRSTAWTDMLLLRLLHSYILYFSSCREVRLDQTTHG